MPIPWLLLAAKTILGVSRYAKSEAAQNDLRKLQGLPPVKREPVKESDSGFAVFLYNVVLFGILGLFLWWSGWLVKTLQAVGIVMVAVLVIGGIFWLTGIVGGPRARGGLPKRRPGMSDEEYRALWLSAAKKRERKREEQLVREGRCTRGPDGKLVWPSREPAPQKVREVPIVPQSRQGRPQEQRPSLPPTANPSYYEDGNEGGDGPNDPTVVRTPHGGQKVMTRSEARHYEWELRNNDPEIYGDNDD